MGNTLKKQFNTAAPTETEVKAFLHAATLGDEKAVTEFLDQYPDAVDVAEQNGITALIFAATIGKEKVVKLLLEKGAAIDKTKKTGKTALLEAAFMGNAHIVSLLLEHGADPTHADKFGDTALACAYMSRDTETVSVIEQWPEKQKQLQKKQREQWLGETDFSKGLRQDLPVRRPLTGGLKK